MAIAPDLEMCHVFQCNRDLNQDCRIKVRSTKVLWYARLMNEYILACGQTSVWHIRVLFPLVTPADTI